MFSWTKSEAIVLPIALAVIIVITVLCAWLLHRKSKEVKSKPLKIIAWILIILEIIKFVNSVVTGFDTWVIPLHYCSMFVFFFPLAQICGEKQGKVIKPVAFITALTMTVLFYFSPGMVISDSASGVFSSFSSFHTFTFHHLVILYVFLSIALNNYKPQKKDFLKLLMVMGIYFIIAMPIAHFLNTNYCNFLSSNIDFIEVIRVNAGQFVYSLVMLVIIVGGTAFMAYLYYLLYSLIKRISVRQTNKN